jgi:hypothetical protein
MHSDHPIIHRQCDPLYPFVSIPLSHDIIINVKTRHKSFLTINHSLDLSMRNHPFVVSHTINVRMIITIASRGPWISLLLLHAKGTNNHFDNLTVLAIINVCRQTTFITLG